MGPLPQNGSYVAINGWNRIVSGAAVSGIFEPIKKLD
jgi:hypothetical protein